MNGTEVLIQQLINGLEIGGLYALWAVAYGIVYQVLGLMHFAFGDTAIFAAYTGLGFILVLNLPLVVAIPLMLLVGAIISMIVERVAYAPLVARGERFSAFIAALGVAYIVRNITTLVWGAQTSTYPQFVPSGIINLGPFTVSLIGLFSLGVAVAVYISVATFLKYSRHGQAIVALEQDAETAGLMGIPAARMVTLVYAVSGVIAVLGTLIFVARFGLITPADGFTITLKAFVAVLIGGVGRIEGAVAGGLLLGVLESLLTQYADPLFTDAIVFTILCVILVVRPRGLMGRVQLVKL